MTDPEFNWHIAEEERDRAAALAEQPGRTAPPRRRGCLRLAAIAALVMALIGAGVYLGIVQPAEEAFDDMKRDVLASHALARRAATEFDLTLLDTVLPDDDPAWRNTIGVLYGRGLLIERGAFGWSALPDSASVELVSFSPDLKEAEVTWEQSYAIGAAHGLTEPIRLRHTLLYRFDKQRWVLSQPGDEFWGRTITTTGELLTIAYPERDEALGLRLARDLAAALNTICVELYTQPCETNKHLSVTLSRDASLLTRMSAPERVWIATRGDAPVFTFSLPAPTLFGTPVDEPGYQALYRMYAMRLIEVFARDRISLQQRDSLAGYRQGKREWLMVQLGLQPWPRVAPDASPLSAPPPEQDILVYCVDSWEQYGTLRRYSPIAGNWTLLQSERLLTGMAALPGGDGVVLLEALSTEGDAARLVLRQNEDERTVVGRLNTPTQVYLTAQSIAPGKLLISQQSLNLSSQRLDHLLVDLDQCDSAVCKVIALADLPVWSPDGTRTLVANFAESQLLLGDEYGETLENLGTGFNPFWVDDDTYGYVTHPYGREAAIVTASLTSGDSHTVLTFGELWPETRVSPEMDLTFRGWPEGEDLLIALSDPSEGQTHLFRIDKRSGDSARLPVALDRAYAGLGFSPDGRWLLGYQFNPVTREPSIQFLDIERNQLDMTVAGNILDPPAFGNPRASWSADSRWFLTLSDGVIHLIAPEHDYRRVVIPPSPGCIFAAWMGQ